MNIHDTRGRACGRQIDVTARRARRALLSMRREGGLRPRWTLGNRGSFEMDADRVEISTERRAEVTSAHVSGRLWNPAGTAMTTIDVDIHAASSTATEVVVTPAQPLPEWFRADDYDGWQRLAAAACDEICEELLFFASRDAQSPASAA